MTEVLHEKPVNTVNITKIAVASAHKKSVGKDPLAEFFGIWAGRDIDAATLRKQTWGIED